jgi:putative membrane protein insertion efficiency factor
MLNKVIIFPLVLLIRGYQLIVSPMLGSNCRFMPTCSEYAMESLKTYGLIKGAFLTFKRIGKCHPWGGHGYDPIPTKMENNKYE